MPRCVMAPPTAAWSVPAPVSAIVVFTPGSQARGAPQQSAAGVHHGRQRLVLDLDQFRRILRVRQGLATPKAAGFADVAHRPASTGCGVSARGGVLKTSLKLVTGTTAGNVAQPSALPGVRAGQHRQHAGRDRFPGGGECVDIPDVRVCVRRAQDEGVRRAGLFFEIVRKWPAPCTERGVFVLLADRLPGGRIWTCGQKSDCNTIGL